MPKRVTLIAAILLILCFPILGKAAPMTPKPVEIYINQEKVISDVAPVLEQGRVLVPLRVISEHFGAQVHWDDTTKTVKVQMSSRLIQLGINENRAFIDGQDVTLDVPAKIVKERTVVPLRFVGEALGAQVHWDDTNKRVIITRVAVNVTAMKYEVTSGMPSIIVEGDTPLEYTSWKPEGKDQLVIDIKGRLATTNNALYIYDDFVDKVVAGSISENPDMVRLVVDLNEKVHYVVKTSEDRKRILVNFVNTLNSVEVDDEKDKFMVDITTTMATPVSSLFLSAPDRLVVDIENAMLLAETPRTPKNDFVEGIRLGQFSTDPNIARVVFDLKKDTNYQVFQTNNKVSVMFSNVSTLSNLEVLSQGIKSTMKFKSDGDIGYEVKADRAKKQIKIVVPGVALGRRFDEGMDVKDGIIDTIEVKKTKDRNNYNTEIIINLTSFSSFELLSTPPSREVELVIYKSSLQNRLIVIDPGHGGDPGAIVGKVQEKSLNLEICFKLRDLLQAQGAKVLMVRDKDIAVDQYVRAGIANEAGADLFISIHNNSATRDTVTGTETWYYPDPDKKAFAQALQKSLVQATGAVDRGVKESVGLIVTRETRMPSALVEVAFMTNPGDLAKVQTPEYQQRVAEGLLQGIVNYLSGL